MRRALVLVPVAAFLFAASAASAAPAAAPLPTRPVYDANGRVIQAPVAPANEPVRLTQSRATAIFLAYPKVRDWLKRYPTKGRVTQTDYSKKYRNWTVKMWWGKAGEIVTGRVDDVECRRRAQVDDDAGRTGQVDRRESIRDPVGADLTRVVHQDRQQQQELLRHSRNRPLIEKIISVLEVSS